MSTRTETRRAQEYVVFRVGELRCGLPIHRIQEIDRNMPITRVHTAPPWVRGVINLRGRIVTIIDLAARLGVQRACSAGSCKTVVAQADDELIGLLVEEVDDIVTPGPTGVLPTPPHLPQRVGQYAAGVLVLEDSLVILLDADTILD